jgi:histidine ammonia-lyase
MINIDGKNLTLENCERVARRNESIALSPNAIKQIEVSHDNLQKLIRSGRPIYGINTGFGVFSEQSIPPEDIRILNRNLILSHAVGTGEALDRDIVRNAMLIRANTLSKGFSGVRPEVIGTLVEMINKGVTPGIPSQGSLGSSGDLCQLSHLALVLSTDANDLVNESGMAEFSGELLPGKIAMQKAGIQRIILEAKEGLALNNGATFSAAIGALSLVDAGNLLDLSVLALSLTLEALLGCSNAFDSRIHQARGMAGQELYAGWIRNMIAGSHWIDSTNRVQDAYSLRCAPQVCGAVVDTYNFGKDILTRELNAATDNPLIFDPGDAISGGNFHGEPTGLVMDYLKIAISELSAVSERRIYRLLDANLSAGLPAMLVSLDQKPGLNSGLMMPHYTAVSLTLESQALANPDSTRSLPASASQEDHNANSLTAARHARDVIENTFHVLAIEILTACQAITIRETLLGNRMLGQGTGNFYRIIRDQLNFIPTDHLWQEDILKIKTILRQNEFQDQLRDYLK